MSFSRFAARQPKAHRAAADVCLRLGAVFPDMPPTDLVPCYYDGQDSSRLSPAQTLTRAECHLRKKKGEGYFVSNGTIFRLLSSVPVAALVEAAAHSTYSHISLQDMHSNVGITPNPEGEPPLDHLVLAAQRKICAIVSGKYTRDVRSPIARGFWPNQPQMEVTAGL